MVKCLIVDDDSMARNSLKRLCEKQPLLEIAGTCDSAEAGLEILAGGEQSVDLIFLDIEMPGLSGIEMLDRLPVIPMVVFTTSNPDYAFDAFEYGAIDFLKKPIAQPRFEQTIQKLAAIQQSNQQFQAHSDSLFVRTEGKFVRLSSADILFFENVGDYVRIRTASGSNHIVHGTLKGIDERLNDPRFLKVHRSFIVNLDKIVDIDESTLVIEKTVIPISRAHKPVLMNRLRFL